MLNDLLKLRNSKQPKSLSNTDTLQYDYKFWSEIDSLTTKHRKAALEILKSASEKPDVPGIILASQKFKTTLKQSEPIKSFDKEVFIDLLLKKYPEISRATLRELATEAVVAGNRRNSYTVEETNV